MMSPRPNTGSGRLRSAKAPSILLFGQHTGHAASMRPMTLPRRANRSDARPWNGPDTLIVRPSRISMDIESDLPWHVLPPDDALARLESSRSGRSDTHTSDHQSLMRITYDVLC